MDSKYLRKVYKAMADFEYVNDSYLQAIQKIIKKLTSDLNHLVDIYDKFKFDVSAENIYSLNEKQLEVRNQDFLFRLRQYIQGVDAAFKVRSDELARVSIQKNKLHLAKNNEKEIQEILQASEDYLLLAFEKAVKRTNNYAHKRMEEAQHRNVTNIKKYTYDFKQLALFENLTMLKVISLLIRIEG